MLNLVDETDAAWVHRVAPHMDEVLVDHAHCEKKAAGAAVKLLFSYPHHRFIQAPLAQLAREELTHFEQILAVLDRRGIVYRSLPPSPYGAKLHALVRRDEPERALDVMLVSALIEARSCERMQALSRHLPDPELAALYADLLAEEARHHGLYLAFARELADPETVRRRFTELAQAESQILRAEAPFPRLHT
ncbi:tRNA-(ms[2]io[6]A)-hydroxylase [Myxococcota bacterium]|nr:tRNA-(ms[2]io[6]A)-hydroxylase [Myxococcota bacterium]